MEPLFWEPYIEKVFISNGIQDEFSIRPGLAGTYPTFVVNNTWVIKFFGRLFEGQESYRVEKAVSDLVNQYRPFPSPSILFHGELFPEENPTWPYLVFRYIPGISIGTILEKIPFTEKKKLAGWLGKRSKLLHEIPVPKDIVKILPQQQKLMTAGIRDCVRRQIQFGFLPDHLINQISSFLKTTQETKLVSRPHHLIHADLTSDHFLGEFTGESWHTHAVIDYGDAMIGNLEYELIPIHLDLFTMNKELLGEFVEGYGKDLISIDELPRAGLRMMRLHRFSIFEILVKEKLNLDECPSLSHLADQIWDIKSN